MEKRRGILTESQREAVQSEYKNLTYHPNKMRADIEEQIDSLEEDLHILKQYDQELYDRIVQAVEES
jgi:methionyl-tRNA formyltransferase